MTVTVCMCVHSMQYSYDCDSVCVYVHSVQYSYDCDSVCVYVHSVQYSYDCDSVVCKCVCVEIDTCYDTAPFACYEERRMGGGGF